MKLIEFLVSTDWFDGELSCLDFESQYGFVWSKDNVFTKAGLKKFKKILNSEIRISTYKNGSVGLFLQDESITEEEYDYFMAANSGYIPSVEYDKYFKEVGENGKRIKR